jgi:hypothetical protein
MSAITAQLIGGLGNQMFIFAHAKAFAEKNGMELHTVPWVGERIFKLDGHKCGRPQPNEMVLSGYFQSQADLIYTRADCRRWFEFSDEAKAICEPLMGGVDNYAIAHLRRGDYAGAGFPVISVKAYFDAAERFGIDPNRLVLIGNERPWGGTSDPATTMLPDFYRMTKAENLFRANSTFSWFAAVLGHGNVFSPVITGLPGGIEHENVQFVRGNHPRCADLDIVTDLFLEEK